MCGLTVYMVKNLLSVIKNTPRRLKMFNIDENTRFFMYAKHECGFSKKAFNHITKTLNITSNKFTIVDPVKKSYICAGKWQYALGNKTEQKQLNKLIDAWNKTYIRHTYPDIYVYIPSRWYYIGGCDDCLSTQINISTSDLLHLLPTIKNNPSTQLRF